MANTYGLGDVFGEIMKYNNKYYKTLPVVPPPNVIRCTGCALEFTRHCGGVPCAGGNGYSPFRLIEVNFTDLDDTRLSREIKLDTKKKEIILPDGYELDKGKSTLKYIKLKDKPLHFHIV